MLAKFIEFTELVHGSEASYVGIVD